MTAPQPEPSARQVALRALVDAFIRPTDPVEQQQAVLAAADDAARRIAAQLKELQ